MSDDIQAELARLRAENEALRHRRSASISIKVSEKGAVSVYGLGRFPVTPYQEQWQKLLGLADDIRNFIEENQGRLKNKEGENVKPDKPYEPLLLVPKSEGCFFAPAQESSV